MNHRGRARARNLAYARNLAHALDRVDTRHEGASGAGTDNPVPGRVPRGVVALATRVLPAWGRSRYREEFLGELTELPRRERFGYALRVLTHAWTLRHALTGHALTGGVRTPDGSPVRRADRWAAGSVAEPAQTRWTSLCLTSARSGVRRTAVRRRLACSSSTAAARARHTNPVAVSSAAATASG